MNKTLKIFFVAAVIFLGGFIAFGVFAQEVSDKDIEARGITFPIPELGGCASKNDCRDYCEEPQNMRACVDFAEKHGLMSSEEADRARRFSDHLETGGPGGCRSDKECDAYCEDVNHIEECLAFAEENDLGDDVDLSEARKIRDYLRSGGALPGNCATRDECETYCEDFSHIEECVAFAEAAGLERPGGEEDLPPPAAIELMKKGETPGGCKSRQECEAYCEDESNFEECIAFAEKAGFISPEEAEMARKTGGKGPGGCNSRESCDAYCNDPAHQEECFEFAKKHGLLDEEELRRIKEGSAQLKSGLEHADERVKECLRNYLGQNIIEDIQADRITPGPEIGERMRQCFEKFGGFPEPEEIFRDIPPDVLECVSAKIDIEGVKSGFVDLTPEVGDIIRACFRAVGFGSGGPGGPGEFNGPSPDLERIIKDAPPEVVRCLENKVGNLERLKQGKFNGLTPEIGNSIRGCFESFDGGPDRGRNFNADNFTRGNFNEPEEIFKLLETGPPEIKKCVENKNRGLLDDFRAGNISKEEAVQTVKECAAGFQGRDFVPAGGGFPENFGEDEFEFEDHGKFERPGDFERFERPEDFKKEDFEKPEDFRGPGRGSFGPSPDQILGQFPGPVAECIKRNLTEADLKNPDKIRSAAEKCFPRVGGLPGGFGAGEGEPPVPPEEFTPPPGSSGNQFPPENIPEDEFFPSDENYSPEDGYDPNAPYPPQGSVSRPSLLGTLLAPFIDLLLR